MCHRPKTQVRYDRYMICLALLHKLIVPAVLLTGSSLFCEQCKKNTNKSLNNQYFTIRVKMKQFA